MIKNRIADCVPRRSAIAVIVGISLSLSSAGCADGYPTEDVPKIDPATMSQAELLVALNTLGKAPHLGKRWRYALHDRCELEVSVRDGSVIRTRVELAGAIVSTRPVDGVSEVRLVPKAGGETRAVTVLESRRWSDTVLATSLLAQLEKRCGVPAS
jgi:hypothetical protein